MPAGPWPYTDDTVMATAIVAMLERHGRIDQDELARDFASRFEREPQRGYGAGAFWLLSQLARGRDWRVASVELFHGGSLGNGSAMRVAPLGAWFADDLCVVVRESIASAEVTHQHADGKAGAVAVAVASALAANNKTIDAPAMLATVLEHTPEGPTRTGVERVTALLDLTPEEASHALGDGREVRCSDTVPFALWCAARFANSYEEAIFAALAGTASHEADRDTILAIVGGITALSSATSIPSNWLAAREPLAL